jgi:hypothetical protein
MTMHLPILHVSCRFFFFGKTSHHPALSAPLQRRGLPATSGFSRSKTAVEREEISDRGRDYGERDEELIAIPKEGFADSFEKWKERWDKCVRSQGEYFEGD